MYLLFFALASAVTALITPVVIRAATRFKCVDLPGKRHVHKKTTPRWGGIAFFIGVLPGFFALPQDKGTLLFLLGAVVVLLVGMLDDRKTLSYRTKFAAMIVATTIVIFGGGTVVRDIGVYTAFGKFELGWMGIPFTYVGILGVTNAMNLLDGLNGLAAGSSLLAFLFMGIAAAMAGNAPLAILCFAFTGALAGFLLFNFPKAKIFMGDTGSLFLGFSLAVIAVQLSQNPRMPVNPGLPFLVLLLPIFDTVRVFLLRITRRRNPFHADKSHLHYLMTRRGMTPTAAVLVIWAMTALFGIAALAFHARTTDAYLQFAFAASLLLSFFTVALAWRRRPRRGACRPPCEEPRRTEQPVVVKVRI